MQPRSLLMFGGPICVALCRNLQPSTFYFQRPSERVLRVEDLLVAAGAGIFAGLLAQLLLLLVGELDDRVVPGGDDRLVVLGSAGQIDDHGTVRGDGQAVEGTAPGDQAEPGAVGS